MLLWRQILALLSCSRSPLLSNVPFEGQGSRKCFLCSWAFCLGAWCPLLPRRWGCARAWGSLVSGGIFVPCSIAEVSAKWAAVVAGEVQTLRKRFSGQKDAKRPEKVERGSAPRDLSPVSINNSPKHQAGSVSLKQA